MKCANCDRDALYIYKITKTKTIPYCAKDLPSFLEDRRKAGLLDVTAELTEHNKTAVEVLVTEKAAPIKKATKKSAE